MKKMGDDAFEARAWDGYGCLKTSDNNTCFTLLMPIIKNNANDKCDGAVESISPCYRYEAMTADRIVCTVRCKPEQDEDEEDEGRDENEPETTKKKSKKSK